MKHSDLEKAALMIIRRGVSWCDLTDGQRRLVSMWFGKWDWTAPRVDIVIRQLTAV